MRRGGGRSLATVAAVLKRTASVERPTETWRGGGRVPLGTAGGAAGSLSALFSAAFDRLRAASFLKVVCVTECVGTGLLSQHLETSGAAAAGMRLRFVGLSFFFALAFADSIPAPLWPLAARQIEIWLPAAMRVDGPRARPRRGFCVGWAFVPS